MSSKLNKLVMEQMRKMGKGLPPAPCSAPSLLTKKAKRPRPDLERQWLDAWSLLSHPTPTRQYRFHAARQWRFDFAWPDAKVAVEVQGGIWSGGGHTRGRQYGRDREKVATAQEMGWLVYEVTDVKDTRLMDRIAGQIRVRSGGGR